MSLTFQPDVESISSTRRFATKIFATVLSDPDATSRLALTIHELLENTLKYGEDGKVTLEVGIDEQGSETKVRVRASNRARPDRIEDLRRRIGALERLDDPMELYVRMLTQAATREHGSGLGLARVRVEAEMDLSLAVDGDRVTITAEAPVEVVRPEAAKSGESELGGSGHTLDRAVDHTATTTKWEGK